MKRYVQVVPGEGEFFFDEDDLESLDDLRSQLVPEIERLGGLEVGAEAPLGRGTVRRLEDAPSEPVGPRCMRRHEHATVTEALICDEVTV